MEIKKNYVFSAGRLFAIAIRAYQRTVEENINAEETMAHAMTAVLLACAALEGYINETATHIHETVTRICNDPRIETVPELVRTFAKTLDEIERSHSSTCCKYLKGLEILTGEPFNKGQRPYQDFDLLFSIRDCLMHHKLEEISNGPHEIVKCLRSRKLCTEEGDVKQSWHERVFTPATAKWACNTAVDMINSIQAALSIAFMDKDKRIPPTPLSFLAGINYRKIE